MKIFTRQKISKVQNVHAKQLKFSNNKVQVHVITSCLSKCKLLQNLIIILQWARHPRSYPLQLRCQNHAQTSYLFPLSVHEMRDVVINAKTKSKLIHLLYYCTYIMIGLARMTMCIVYTEVFVCSTVLISLSVYSILITFIYLTMMIYIVVIKHVC